MQKIDGGEDVTESLFLGLSGAWWDVALIAAAVFAAISTTGSIVAHKREASAAEKSLESYKLTVDKSVADAKREGIEAGKTAGDAMLRAAQLEKEAANARLETERLKSAVAWRDIPEAEITVLTKLLSVKSGSVNLRYMDGDPEALFLAIQFARVFEKAKWQVAPGAIKPSNAIYFGLGLPDSGTDDADALRTAFQAARITYGTHAVEVAVAFSISTIPGAPILMIGSRPPAVIR